MKILIAIMGLVSSVSVFASPFTGAIEAPPEFCSSDCPPAMEAIAKQFDSLRSAPSHFPSVLSGECYYQGFDTDPAVTQYGMVVLDQQTFSGVFSFFNTANPYSGLNLEDAQALLKSEGSPISPMSFGDTYAAIEYLSPKSDILYWLREASDTHEVLLVSQWRSSGGVEIFCRLSPN